MQNMILIGQALILTIHIKFDQINHVKLCCIYLTEDTFLNSIVVTGVNVVHVH